MVGSHTPLRRSGWVRCARSEAHVSEALNPRSVCLMSAFPRLPACLVTASLLTPFAPAWSATPTDPAPALDGTSGTKASFAHSGMKTVTYEIGNTLNNFAFLTVGVGGLTGGVLLTAFNTLQSWTVYTTNDYLWEWLYPRTTSKDAAASFDVKQSFWHTSLKYMTGKPVVASIKIAAALCIYRIGGDRAGVWNSRNGRRLGDLLRQ